MKTALSLQRAKSDGTSSRNTGYPVDHDSPGQQTLRELQQDANGSANVTRLGEMRGWANADGRVPMQRVPDDVDLSESALDDEAEEQEEAVSGQRAQFRGQLKEKIAEIDPKRKVEASFFDWVRGRQTVQAQFEQAAWTVIDESLPGMLDHRLASGGRLFENGMAAIRFMQDVFLKFLDQDHALLDAPDLAGALRRHLEGVYDMLQIGAGGSEDEDDDAPQSQGPEKRSHGKADKRYVDARKRIASPDRKQEEHSDAVKVRTRLDAADRMRYRHEVRNSFWTDRAQDKADACQYLIGAPGPAIDAEDETESEKKSFAYRLGFVEGYYFLRLLRTRAAANRTAGVVFAMHRAAGRLAKPYTSERNDLAANLAQLGLLGNDGDHGENGAFRTGRGMADIDLQAILAKERTGENESRRQQIDEARERDSGRVEKAKQEEQDERAGKLVEARNALTPGEIEHLNAYDSNWTKPTAANVALARAVRLGRNGGTPALDAFEDYLAHLALPPGTDERPARVVELEANKLLGQTDIEVLKFSTRSMKSIVKAALDEGWATSDEIEMGNRMLGTAAFTGILDSHMQRGKPGPLRAMIEQLRHQKDAILISSPPLRSASLILDTNMVEVLVTPLGSLRGHKLGLRKQLNDVLVARKIADIRLANMNIAELSSVGRLLGTVVTVELHCAPGELAVAPLKLPVLGVPYRDGRSGGRYAEVFRQMEEKKVGENKGNADRSMMADIFLAEREKDAVPHFATADKGVAKEVGPGENQFDPGSMGLPDLVIHTMEQVLPQALDAKDAAKDGAKDQDKPAVKDDAKDKKGRPRPGGKRAIWGFPVGEQHTALSVARLIMAAGSTHFPERTYQVYVVGGAVRDFVRGTGGINDVDMKTNMPVDELMALMAKEGLPLGDQSALNLVTVGSGEAKLDIVCTAAEAKDGPVAPVDLKADAASRDFKLNAMYLDASAESLNERNHLIASDERQEQAKQGLLRFSADPGAGDFEERAASILAHLREKPENFGRALKFIQRGHDEWLAAKREYDSKKSLYLAQNQKRRKKQGLKQPLFAPPNAYHLDAAVLDLLRKNAMQILAPLVDPDLGPHRKGLFIHQSGFKAPLEMVDVMRRLNFPPEAIQMVYPDTVAGSFADRTPVFSREVTPRMRAVGPVGDWDPKAPPVIKHDATSGRVYQYRFFAYCGPVAADSEADAMPADARLLIDVDYSDHDVKGHPAPHFHVYRIVEGRWHKNSASYSRTGQPGEPPVSMRANGRHFDGPLAWTWFQPKEGDELLETVVAAGKLAHLDIKATAETIDFHGLLTIPRARLAQLHANKRIPQLLLLLHNLDQGKHWDDADDTVQILTGSKDDRERLRFTPQLERARRFLVDVCGIDDPEGKVGKDGVLDQAALERIYDLSNTGHGPETAVPAARYAVAKLAGKPDPDLFVSYFEYYVAATRDKVERAGLDLLHRRTIKHGGAAMVKPSDQGKVKLPALEQAKAVQEQATQLRFKDEATAAYHLHKHLGMVTPSADALHRENRAIKQAAREYVDLCHQTVAQGLLQKSVVAGKDLVKLYFAKDSITCVVEANTATLEAHILTCYEAGAASHTFQALQEEDRDQEELADMPIRSGKATDGGPRRDRALRHYLTEFGTFGRYTNSSDGDCFFHAVADWIGPAASARGLRTQAVHELRNHYTEQFNGTYYTDFIIGGGTAAEKMGATATYLKKSGNWSRDDGDLVPELMARALGRTIYILSKSNGAVVQVMGPPNSNPIFVFYNGGTHYEIARRG